MKLRQWTHSIPFVLALAGFFAALLLMSAGDEEFLAHSQGLGKLDMRMGYTPEDVTLLFTALGPRGSLVYARFLILDVFFIFCFAVVQAGLTKRALQSRFSDRLVRVAMLAAWIRAALDLLENALIYAMMQLPGIHPAITAVCSVVTILKFIVLLLAAIGVPVLLIVGRLRTLPAAKSRAIVVVESSTGVTRHCAEQIAQIIGADIVQRGRAIPAALLQYETIVFGGGIAAGRIVGAAWLSRMQPYLAGKRIIVFSTGFTPADSGEVLSAVRGRDFSQAQRAAIEFFHIPSGIRYSRLRPLHRLMLLIRFRSLHRQPESKLSEANRVFLHSYGKDSALPDRSKLHALAQAILR